MIIRQRRIGMSEWEPIETAPKDGTHILGYGEEWPEIAVVVYTTGWDFYPYSDTDVGELSHWMPLPAPPTSGT